MFIPPGGAVSACRERPFCLGVQEPERGGGTRRARQGRRDQARPARGMEERMRRGWGRGRRGAGRGWGGDRGRSETGTEEPGLLQPALVAGLSGVQPWPVITSLSGPPSSPTEVFRHRCWFSGTFSVLNHRSHLHLMPLLHVSSERRLSLEEVPAPKPSLASVA